MSMPAVAAPTAAAHVLGSSLHARLPLPSCCGLLARPLFAQSLKDRRGANKQRLLMSEASARYYMGCLLLALEFLHNNGLLHRDVSDRGPRGSF